MRVGILTLHSGANYGGTLQCVALSHVLKNLGAEVQIINYVPKVIAPIYLRILYRITTPQFFKNIFKKTPKANGHSIKSNISQRLVKVFDDYRRSNLQLTKLVDEISISDLNDEFDIIIVGSDQVWSSFVRSKLTYFGDWSPEFNGKLISYAACSTNDNYPIIRKSKIKRLLRRFDVISVRDEASHEIIAKLTNKDISVVLDPTFLYDFNEIENTTSPFQNPYVFVYVLGSEHPEGNDLLVQAIRDKLNNPNLRIIAVSTNDDIIGYADETLTDVNPVDWLKLIRHAEFVITDSFHASVFSLKYRKPVLAYYAEKNRASRLIDLFNKTNMNNSLLHANE